MITINLTASDLYQISLWMVLIAITLIFAIRDTMKALDWWELRKVRKRQYDGFRQVTPEEHARFAAGKIHPSKGKRECST